MTAIFDEGNRKYDFQADAYLNRGPVDELMNTTGQRNINMMLTSQQESSAQGKQGGKIYKFKNIHGDRGTFAGLSSKAQNQPPSSMWHEHPTIPAHLMEPKGI